MSYEYEGSLDIVDSELYADPFELPIRGKFGRVEDLRRNLTFVHLTGRLANLVYSMGVTNTDFYPHQYRPLLTLLESPGTGILIADEVGLGKTIEAGLIWTEYRARYDKRRLLVVCPAMLREKWRDELDLRFGVKAEIVGAAELLNSLRTRRHSVGPDIAWIASYQALRPPRGWDPTTVLSEGETSGAAELAAFLQQHAEAEALFDMVVFDEAHYMRNRETGAWKLGDLLREVSAYQVMLSATPINMRNDDLFSLLTLLDPEHFVTPDDLNRLIQSNRPLVAARDIALNLKRSAADFVAALSAARMDPLLGKSAQLERLTDSEPTEAQFQSKRFRAELAEAVERTNLLSHVLTRTRKRDIHERRIERRVYSESIVMSPVEQKFYSAVTDAIRNYAVEREIGEGFLLAMPQRQASSSPAALLRSWGGQSDVEDDDLTEDPLGQFNDERPARHRLGPLRAFLQASIPGQVSLGDLERHDSKLSRTKVLLKELFARDPTEKVILFTTFRATARYIAEKLTAAGICSVIVWGQGDKPKHVVIEEFRDDPMQRVLISTEVAAEGVDLQFSRTVINYDMPWNPTRVEQRIGRVDRLGQRSEHIFVWNLYFADTIDERIVKRLLQRLHIFEEALGEAEAIVGEIVTRLEYELLCRPRTAEEEDALIDRAALALETVARQRRELEENAPHMLAHGQRVLERIAAAQQLARFVTAEDLFTFVRDSLVRHWPKHEFTSDPREPLRVQLRLPPELLVEWEPFLRNRHALGQTRLAQGSSQRVIFRNNVTERFSADGETIHQFHPLIGFLAADLKRREEQFFPVVAIQVSAVDVSAVAAPGDYGFSVFQWSFSGVHQEEWLISAVAALGSAESLDEAASDLLLQIARLRGSDWLGVANEVSGVEVKRALEFTDEVVAQRFGEVASRKHAENEDRARFQMDSIDRHRTRRLQTLELVEGRHRAFGREALVKATQGQRRVLLERMEARVAAVHSRQQVMTSSRFVCGGVIRVR